MSIPTVLARVGLAVVVALLVVFGVFRLEPVDLPSHTAMGRIIWETGAPVTTNLLSWTHPDVVNGNQYPIYQLMLYGLQATFGWGALSVLTAVSWTAAVLLWMRWAGPVPHLVRTTPIWFLAVLGVQRHLVARPEVFTILGLAALLVAFESWRRQPRTGPLVAMVAILWAMVNLHQLYVIGVVLVAGFVVHVAVTRAVRRRGWLDDTDADLPVAPLVLTWLAGVVAIAISPLGFGAWWAPLSLVATVSELGMQPGSESAELRPIWTDPIGGPVTAVLLLVVAVQLWRSRGRWQVLELGVLAMGTGLVMLALRGVPFFAVASAAVSTRLALRVDRPTPELARFAADLATVLLAGFLLVTQLLPRPHAFMSRQQGLGRSVGEWGDEICAFLRTHPPPGEMMNVGWGAANFLVWGTYPQHRVFVDGRWEAYPKRFLAQTFAMQYDPDVLDTMIDEWAPGFVVVELREPAQHHQAAHLLEQGWALVYVDSIGAVLVPETAADYLGAHRLEPAAIDPPDWLPEHPVLHAQQKIRLGHFLTVVGDVERGRRWFAEGTSHDHPAVAQSAETFALSSR